MCKAARSWSMFAANHRSADGHQHECRDCRAILRQRSEAGLLGQNSGTRWTQPEDRYVMRNDLPIHTIAEVLGRTYSAVCVRRNRLAD